MNRSTILAEMIGTDTVSCETAFAFLGIPDTSDAGYRMARRYRERMKDHRHTAVDVSVLRPRRFKSGEWAEIANDKIAGRIRCRTDLLIEMVYPEGIVELLRRGAA